MFHYESNVVLQKESLLGEQNEGSICRIKLIFVSQVVDK